MTKHLGEFVEGTKRKLSSSLPTLQLVSSPYFSLSYLFQNAYRKVDIYIWMINIYIYIVYKILLRAYCFGVSIPFVYNYIPILNNTVKRDGERILP